MTILFYGRGRVFLCLGDVELVTNLNKAFDRIYCDCEHGCATGSQVHPLTLCNLRLPFW